MSTSDRSHQEIRQLSADDKAREARQRIISAAARSCCKRGEEIAAVKRAVESHHGIRVISSTSRVARLEYTGQVSYGQTATRQFTIDVKSVRRALVPA